MCHVCQRLLDQALVEKRALTKPELEKLVDRIEHQMQHTLINTHALQDLILLLPAVIGMAGDC